jgi:hypothetical protein
MTTPGPQPRPRQQSSAAEAATATRPADPNQADPRTAETMAVSETAAEAVMARAAAGGYAMVGPSARTWSVDPATGIPVGPVSQGEHRLVRDLIAQERLDGTEPVWLPCAGGGDEIVAWVVPARTDVDDPAVETDIGPDDLASDTDADSTVPVAVTDAAAEPAPDAGGYPAAGGAASKDTEGWFCGGSDTAHDACLAAVSHIDIPGPLEPDPPAEHRHPTRRGDLAGLGDSAGRADPEGLAARLTAIGNRAAEATAGAPVGGWQTVSAARAADELVGRGYDPDTARAMVGAYLRDTSERAGTPAYAWGLDQADIDAITTQAITTQHTDTDARATDARSATRGLPAAAVRVVAEQDAAAADRAVQLGRWHVDDKTVLAAEAGDTTADTEDGLTAGLVDGAVDGLGDEPGWSR